MAFLSAACLAFSAAAKSMPAALSAFLFFFYDSIQNETKTMTKTYFRWKLGTKLGKRKEKLYFIALEISSGFG